MDELISYLEKKLIEYDNNYGIFIENLEKETPYSDLITCLKYILENKNDTRLLTSIIKYINKKRHKELLAALIDFILKPNAENSFNDLKVLAIKTISNYKDTQALPSLLYCLNDKHSNYKIRLASAEALGKIGDKNAFDSLSNVICDEKEKSTYIKESAVVALGLLGDKRALDIFDSILNTKQIFLDKFSCIKERIVEAMSKLDISRDKKALTILKNSLLDPSARVRVVTIETLMNSNLQESYELIYERLKFDDDLEVKKNALVALYNISDRKILDEVVSSDFEDELKNYAKEIIEQYEDINE